MSDTDSFIEEVTEEVRRDRLFAWMKRYGWMVIGAVIIIVGGAGFIEYRKAQATAQYQAFGDAILAALDNNEAAERAMALASIQGSDVGGRAILALLTSKEQFDAGSQKEAQETLQLLASDADVPLVYRQVASFKLLALQENQLSLAERKAGYEALIGGNPQLEVLVEEQLALIEIEQGNTEEAIAALSSIVQDSEATPGLRRRATQLIVALGGDVPVVATAQEQSE
ncbi:tetratricopeptide repeat protein [Lentibacter algarum]|uniref:tetratricopeptide repeat protein n=2 Tax=Lentibacter algarum TaxID=576131 RepID=UPI0026EBCCF6|nr:tetratricopeptide repeat protein [Lentibacter algarum]